MLLPDELLAHKTLRALSTTESEQISVWEGVAGSWSSVSAWLSFPPEAFFLCMPVYVVVIETLLIRTDLLIARIARLKSF